MSHHGLIQIDQVLHDGAPASANSAGAALLFLLGLSGDRRVL